MFKKSNLKISVHINVFSEYNNSPKWSTQSKLSN